MSPSKRLLSPVWTVIRREYLQRVRNRWFVVTTLGIPVLLLGAGTLPILMGERDNRRESHITVVDETGILLDRVKPRLEEAGYTIDTTYVRLPVEQLDILVIEGDLGGYLVLDDQTLETGTAHFIARSSPGTLRRFGIEQTVARSALEAGLERAGADVELAALIEDPDVRFTVLGTTGVDDDNPAFIVAFAGTFFLYFVIFFYGVAVLRSVLEEKTGRIVEVIVSSMRPWQLMLGKILGVGAVGLTQLAVWVGSAAAMSLLAVPGLVVASGGADSFDLAAHLPGAGVLAAFSVLFLLGYFLYAGLFAAAGAMCSTEEEAQQAQFPIIMLLVVPFMLVVAAIQNGGSPLWVALSLFPFFTPILMYARQAAGLTAPWEIWAGILVMVVAILAVAWVAGRIYKVGILMQGKRPTLPEVWRWIKEA